MPVLSACVPVCADGLGIREINVNESIRMVRAMREREQEKRGTAETPFTGCEAVPFIFLQLYCSVFVRRGLPMTRHFTAGDLLCAYSRIFLALLPACHT